MNKFKIITSILGMVAAVPLGSDDFPMYSETGEPWELMPPIMDDFSFILHLKRPLLVRLRRTGDPLLDEYTIATSVMQTIPFSALRSDKSHEKTIADFFFNHVEPYAEGKIRQEHSSTYNIREWKPLPSPADGKYDKAKTRIRAFMRKRGFDEELAGKYAEAVTGILKRLLEGAENVLDDIMQEDGTDPIVSGQWTKRVILFRLEGEGEDRRIRILFSFVGKTVDFTDPSDPFIHGVNKVNERTGTYKRTFDEASLTEESEDDLVRQVEKKANRTEDEGN